MFSYSVNTSMLNSKLVKNCCDGVFDLSSLILIGMSIGILLLFWVVVRLRQEVNYR